MVLREHSLGLACGEVEHEVFGICNAVFVYLTYIVEDSYKACVEVVVSERAVGDVEELECFYGAYLVIEYRSNLCAVLYADGGGVRAASHHELAAVVYDDNGILVAYELDSVKTRN